MAVSKIIQLQQNRFCLERNPKLQGRESRALRRNSRRIPQTNRTSRPVLPPKLSKAFLEVIRQLQSFRYLDATFTRPVVFETISPPAAFFEAQSGHQPAERRHVRYFEPVCVFQTDDSIFWLENAERDKNEGVERYFFASEIGTDHRRNVQLAEIIVAF